MRGPRRRSRPSGPTARIERESMAINRELLGREYPSPEPYEVTRGKIREFAEAIGDANPVYTDPEAARKAGHPDVVAPPTFPIILSMAGAGQAVLDPELGLDFSMVVHGEQRFRYSRPVRAGDAVRSGTRMSGSTRAAGSAAGTPARPASGPGGETAVTPACTPAALRGGEAPGRAGSPRSSATTTSRRAPR